MLPVELPYTIVLAPLILPPVGGVLIVTVTGVLSADGQDELLPEPAQVIIT